MKKTVTLLMVATALTGCTVPAETAQPPAAGQAQASGRPAEQTSEQPKTPKRWTTVATLNGTGNKRGGAFHLGDGDARLVYTVKDTSGMGAMTLAVYIIGKGDSLEQSGGFPEVMADQAGKDTTRLAKDPGDYYLDVQAANARWTVTVQQKR